MSRGYPEGMSIARKENLYYGQYDIDGKAGLHAASNGGKMRHSIRSSVQQKPYLPRCVQYVALSTPTCGRKFFQPQVVG